MSFHKRTWINFVLSPANVFCQFNLWDSITNLKWVEGKFFLNDSGKDNETVNPVRNSSFSLFFSQLCSLSVPQSNILKDWSIVFKISLFLRYFAYFLIILKSVMARLSSILNYGFVTSKSFLFIHITCSETKYLLRVCFHRLLWAACSGWSSKWWEWKV